MIGDLLINLSKSLDGLPHNVVIAKSNAYGFNIKAIRFDCCSLTCCKQWTEITDTYSSWVEILLGVQWGSILKPLLFYIDMCDLFFIMECYVIPNYRDDNKPYLSWRNVEEVLGSLENVSSNF